MRLSYFNIQKFCIHDGPGIRTTVFLKGCPLQCKWCHNPESQRQAPELLFSRSKCTGCGRCIGICDARAQTADGVILFDRAKCTACGRCAEKCPQNANAIRGKTDEVDEILRQVARDLPFYRTSGGGMTVSGGEPSTQPEAVLELFEKAAQLGISGAIETCGTGTAAFYEKLCDLNAIFLFDIKGIDPAKHKANTGVNPARIHQNLELLIARGAKIILRMPLIPGLNDSDEDLVLLREFLRQKAGHIEYAEIMPYHRLGVEKRRSLDIPDDDSIPDGKAFVPRWQSFLEGSGVTIKVSGS